MNISCTTHYYYICLWRLFSLWFIIFSASRSIHSASRTALTTMWTRSHCPPTQFKCTQHNTHHSVQWQFGSGIEDNAYMGAVAREFSYVFGMADTSSYSVIQAVILSRGGWWPFAPLLHKRSNACHGGQEGASACVSSIKVHLMYPLNMSPRSTSLTQINYDWFCLYIAWCTVTSRPHCSVNTYNCRYFSIIRPVNFKMHP